MKISVVVPAYNEGKYISDCLTSLMNQTEPADEIIVVDNNCTDNTVEVASRFPVKIIRETTQGMIPARNAGLNAAQYEIIARGDADTRYPSDWLKKIKMQFADANVVGVTGPGAFTGLPDWAVELYFQLTKLVLGHAILFGANMSVRKSAWEKISNSVCMNDTEVHEDIDLSIHLHPFGKIIYDKTLQVRASSRRLKNNPTSFFLEYPKRWVQTVFFQKHVPVILKD